MGLRGAVLRAGVIGRLLQYLWRERIWWMIPMVVVLLLFVGLVMFSQSSAVAPFIYTLF
jgi:hypothetical protein